MFLNRLGGNPWKPLFFDFLKFHKRDFVDIPKKTPQTRANSNIVENFGVRNDENVVRRVNATPDVTTRPLLKTTLRNEKATVARGWIVGGAKIGPVLDFKNVDIKIVKVLKYWLNLYFEMEQLLGISSWTGSTHLLPKRQKPQRILSTGQQGNLLLKQDRDWSPQWRCLLFLFLHVMESGSKSILRNMTMIASRCLKPWYDCYDTVNQSIAKKMEQSYFTTSYKNSRRKSSMVFCNGQIAIGYPLWQREEDKRKGFNILLSALPVFQSYARTFGR